MLPQLPVVAVSPTQQRCLMIHSLLAPSCQDSHPATYSDAHGFSQSETAYNIARCHKAIVCDILIVAWHLENHGNSLSCNGVSQILHHLSLLGQSMVRQTWMYCLTVSGVGVGQQLEAWCTKHTVQRMLEWPIQIPIQLAPICIQAQADNHADFTA